MHRRTFIHTLISGLGILGFQSAMHRTNGISRKILLQESPLAGYQYHRAPGVWPFLREGEQLRLIREPHNRHDPNAIAVWFKNDMLGYVPRRENRTLAQVMDRGEKLKARITRLLVESDPWQRLRFEVFLDGRAIT